jgi:acyl-CoA thioester hydrolase
MSGRTFEARLRVRYAETDQMGVVYHSNFIIWFEVGRVEAMRALGFNYKQMEQEDGCYIVVVDARCRYKSPAYYDDDILVRTRVRNVRGSMIHFGYEILRAGEDLVLAEGETTHIVTDAKMQRHEMPEKYQQALAACVSHE